MCYPSQHDNSAAEQARRAEQQRQAAINAGTAKVNDVFSKFDDDYYAGIERASNDYYLPQVEDQYEDARKKLVLQLGRTGRIDGSSGARELGELDERYQTQRADIANRGVTAANEYRGKVEQNRSDVLSQLYASADPSAAATTAAARAESLTAPPAFSALGNLFGDLVRQGGTALAVEKNRLGPGYKTGLFNRPARGGNDSVTYVD